MHRSTRLLASRLHIDLAHHHAFARALFVTTQRDQDGAVVLAVGAQLDTTAYTTCEQMNKAIHITWPCGQVNDMNSRRYLPGWKPRSELDCHWVGHPDTAKVHAKVQKQKAVRFSRVASLSLT